MIVTEFRDAQILAASNSGSSATEATLGECDVLVLSANNQQRCCEIIASGSSATQSVFILGNDKTDSDDVRAAHLERLIEFAADKYNPVALSTLRLDGNQTLTRLREEVALIYQRLRRPIIVGVDLTCSPVFYALGLVSFLLNNGVVCSIRVFYAEGEYPEEIAEEDRHELFTAGDWDVVAVPGLQYPWIPSSNRLYVVAIGFEGNKTLRLCERREPDEVVILFPDPGVRPTYVRRTQENNEAFLDRYSVNENTIVRANASDAVAAWKALTELNFEQRASSTVEYLCCGTKPHSLGIALRALCTRNGVVSDIAAPMLPTDVKPSGVYWRYDIRDLSAL